MSEKPRTITIITCDHGHVTVTCPDWCTGEHPGQVGIGRCDITHTGTPLLLTTETVTHGAQLLGLTLAQAPFSEASIRKPYMSVDIGHEDYPMGPYTLLRLAAGLRAAAVTVEEQADRLAKLRGLAL